MATADKKATAKALAKAAKKVKSPSRAKAPSAPQKEKGTPKNLMTFYVSAKGTVIGGHVTSKNKSNAYFQFDIDGNQLQLRWALKGTTAAAVRVLNASLAKNTADELCDRLREKFSPGFRKILLPIFAWLIERVKNNTLDQPKIGRCWRKPFQKSEASAPKKVSFIVGPDSRVKTRLTAPCLLVELTGSDVEMWHVWGSNPKEDMALVFSGPLKSCKPARSRIKKSVTVPEGQRILAIVVLDWLMDKHDTDYGSSGIAMPQKGFRFSPEEPSETPGLPVEEPDNGVHVPVANSTAESVFTERHFVERTKAWQLSQVTGYDMLVCRKMLERVGYDLDAAHAAFIDAAERIANNLAGTEG